VTATFFLADPTPLTPSTATIPELLELGTALQSARQAQGLTLPELAAKLNMGLEQLEALESGERERLPEPVFVVAQARRVSGALKVDLNPLIEALGRNPQFAAARNGSPSALRGSSASAAPGAPVAPQSVVTGAPMSAPWGARLQALLGVAAIGIAAIGLVAVGLGAGPRGGWRLPDLKSLLPAPPSPKASNQAKPAPAAKLQSPVKLPPAPGQEDATNKLVLVASGVSWLEVKTVGGQSLFRGNFSGERSFPLGQGLRVLSGRPDLVSVRLGNAKPKRLGPIEQVIWRSFKVPAP
jgi:transcriptional regulator with XRE-family HTH domain